MLKTAKVVVGSNFGDEGKGLITDFFAAPAGAESLVVRYNGGAQAGHTVTTPDGKRHVFSHFGSGSFAGAATFLSKYFVCNPLLFIKEHSILAAKGVHPVVHIDARAMISTPYDMMINQIAEETRGDARHGSCGMGFGETIERHEASPHALLYADLSNRAMLKQKLQAVRQDWVPKRLERLGMTLNDEWRDRIYSDGLLEKFMEDIAFFCQVTKGVGGAFLGDHRGNIVFEGAQGLLLDQQRGWFPHVTRSYTGIRNVLDLASEAGIDQLDVAYITRAYATRHGAGPLPHELAAVPYAHIKDETNITNAYQGSLRFAWLDADLLAETIRCDLDQASSIKLRHGLAVTCLDQVDDDVTFMADKKQVTKAKDAFVAHLRQAVDAKFLIASVGPTRKDVSLNIY